MLSAISMEHFNSQIKEELCKLDKRFLSLKEMSGERTRDLACDACTKSFPTSQQLILHQKTHTGQIPHICHGCLRSFVLKENLANHDCNKHNHINRVNNHQQSHTCKVCQKSFSNAKYLKVHMRNHSGVKPYRCNFCNKAFAYQQLLKMHQVAHYGARVYQCTICNTTFPTKKEMEQHILKHDDERVPPQHGHHVRPSSTGSLSGTERSASPAASSLVSTSTGPGTSPLLLASYMSRGFQEHQRRTAHDDIAAVDLTKCSPAELILPSINNIYRDEDLASLPSIATDYSQTSHKSGASAASKVSVVRRNPVFPITDNLMHRLIAEDREKFGTVGVVHVPSMDKLLAMAAASKMREERRREDEEEEKKRVDAEAAEQQEEPMDLTKAVDEESAPAKECTFSEMELSSLPPIKRRLLAAASEKSRTSVIQFALKTEN